LKNRKNKQDSPLKSYRIIFAGTPDFASAALTSLIKSQHKVVAVYTQPDRPAGRGQRVIESPVKTLAQKYQIPIEQPHDFKATSELLKLASYNADLMIVAAYGIILPVAVLETPKIACLNIHASLLPKWRGAAPIQRAILAGENKTGITIMLMAEGLDTGDILLIRETNLETNDTGSSLHDRLDTIGQQAIIESLDDLNTYLLQRCPQNEGLASYAKKLSKAEARINWSLPAQEINRAIHAFNSWPVAYSALNNINIRIWDSSFVLESVCAAPGEICSHANNKIGVACSDGIIFLESLQMPGKKVLPSKDVLNSKQELFAIGQCFEN